jgi:hypothetical protein
MVNGCFFSSSYSFNDFSLWPLRWSLLFAQLLSTVQLKPTKLTEDQQVACVKTAFQVKIWQSQILNFLQNVDGSDLIMILCTLRTKLSHKVRWSYKDRIMRVDLLRSYNEIIGDAVYVDVRCGSGSAWNPVDTMIALTESLQKKHNIYPSNFLQGGVTGPGHKLERL